MNHYFILGREKKISTAEIAVILNTSNYKIQGDILKVKKEIDAKSLIEVLGGTIKIGTEINNNLSLQEIKEEIIKNLQDNTGKINFGLSFYGEIKTDTKKLGLEIKKELKNLGKSVRYVEGKEGILNAAQIIGNKIIEKGGDFIIENEAGKYNLAKTVAIQNVNEWSKRDFDRPGSDSLSGMLPPKLSMMMINLSGAKKTDIILDPFCGSGTILTEALYMEYKNLIGSDFSAKAVEDTEKNVEWMAKEFEEKSQNSKIELHHIDIVDITKKIKEKSIDTIITEPYLGKPLRGNEDEEFILNQTQELKELYISAFENFKNILKPNGIVVFIIPQFKYKNDWIKIDCLKEIKDLGFKQENFENKEYLLYHRSNQKLGRGIYKFKKI